MKTHGHRSRLVKGAIDSTNEKLGQLGPLNSPTNKKKIHTLALEIIAGRAKKTYSEEALFDKESHQSTLLLDLFVGRTPNRREKKKNNSHNQES